MMIMDDLLNVQAFYHKFTYYLPGIHLIVIIRVGGDHGPVMEVGREDPGLAEDELHHELSLHLPPLYM